MGQGALHGHQSLIAGVRESEWRDMDRRHGAEARKLATCHLAARGSQKATSPVTERSFETQAHFTLQEAAGGDFCAQRNTACVFSSNVLIWGENASEAEPGKQMEGEKGGKKPRQRQ